MVGALRCGRGHEPYTCLLPSTVYLYLECEGSLNEVENSNLENKKKSQEIYILTNVLMNVTSVGRGTSRQACAGGEVNGGPRPVEITR